ncbi:hypothetical protein [Streptomyces sp. SA15]|uniref:hypothetical protein n=1 Tax=Streptomyces sp. SA15 TaxID=934019 RepID=UPI00211C3B00|nr:hypothetical protein [Streptomyces sp. SA15]
MRSLINEGNAFAVKADLSAGTYYETDQYVEGTSRSSPTLPSAIRTPPTEVTGMGWGDIATSGVYGGDVDYSKESFDQAMTNSSQGWKDAGRDLMTSRTVGPLGLNPENLHANFGVSDAEYDQMLDDTFGPSPEARAQAAQQQGGSEQ